MDTELVQVDVGASPAAYIWPVMNGRHPMHYESFAPGLDRRTRLASAIGCSGSGSPAGLTPWHLLRYVLSGFGLRWHGPHRRVIS